jgi:site-specific DNA recombinase
VEQRVPLEGLVVQPVVTQEEFDWVQQRRRYNQQYAAKNTRLRVYLLKGRIRCGLCGKRYTGVTRGSRSYYYCRGRTKLDWGEEKCPAQSLPAGFLEKAVCDSVTQFLTTPQIFLAEVGRRRELQEHTVASLKLELADLERQARAEEDAEGQAFRLASRHSVSEEVFQKELAAIQNRRQEINEQTRRVLTQLETLKRGWPTAAVLKGLEQRLGAVLTSEVARAGASCWMPWELL